jgi:hypothetical protein
MSSSAKIGMDMIMMMMPGKRRIAPIAPSRQAILENAMTDQQH